MKYIKEYNSYNSDIEQICKQYGIKRWSIRNGLVDVKGNVDLSNKTMTKLPLNFGEVNGFFNCSGCGLTTLEGSPQKVAGDFNCSRNRLTTLKGGPKEVGYNFDCSSNQLETLEGGPTYVGRGYNCKNNFLQNLDGIPKHINEFLSCSNNSLTTTESFPTVGALVSLNVNPMHPEILNNINLINKILKSQDEFQIWEGGELNLDNFRSLLRYIDSENMRLRDFLSRIKNLKNNDFYTTINPTSIEFSDFINFEKIDEFIDKISNTLEVDKSNIKKINLYFRLKLNDIIYIDFRSAKDEWFVVTVNIHINDGTQSVDVYCDQQDGLMGFLLFLKKLIDEFGF